MNKKQRGIIIYNSIWLVFAFAIVIMSITLIAIDAEENLGNAVAWCVAPIIPTIVVFIFKGVKDGWKTGKKDVTVVVGDGYVAKKHNGFLYAILSIIIYTAGSIIFAPIVLIIHIVKSINTIRNTLKEAKSGQIENN